MSIIKVDGADISVVKSTVFNNKEYKIKYQNGITIREETCRGDGMEVESGLLFITNRHCRVAAYQISSIINVSSVD